MYYIESISLGVVSLKLEKITVLLLLLILSVFTGPLRAEEGVGIARGNPLQCVSASSRDIAITVHYLDRSERIELVGKSNNPFLDWGGTPLTVFKITVEYTPVAMKFFPDTIELIVAGASRGTFPEFYIAQYWDYKLRSYSGNFWGHRRRYGGWSSGGVNYNLRKYMLRNHSKVKPGKEFVKLVVFEGILPLGERVELVLPVYDSTGTLIHPFRFVYEG
jgi:hypothetical protein